MRDELTDPVNATTISISRRGFAVLGSAALIGAASPSPQDFGKPHPPIVSEDDPAIRVSKPQLTPSEGGAIGAYAATPLTVNDRSPGVVVIQAIWGVDAQLRDVVRRYAKAGYVTIAPMLYGRLNPPSGDDSSDITPFRAIAEKMYAQGYQPGDIAAAREWIGTQSKNGKAGITGFCMGGGIVLSEIAVSKAFAAASVFYGDVLGVSAQAITSCVLGSYGARDTSIKPSDVQAFFAQLTPPHDLKIYTEAGHAFFDDTRTRYVPSAADDAWSRTMAWFQKYLT